MQTKPSHSFMITFERKAAADHFVDSNKMVQLGYGLKLWPREADHCDEPHMDWLDGFGRSPQ